MYRKPLLAVIVALVPQTAHAGFQVYGTVDVTWTLGATIPIGVALGIAGGGASEGDLGVEALAFAELALTPRLPAAISVGARVGPEMLLDQSEWFYLPGLATHAELGWTFRPKSWSGLRVGGDVTYAFLTARYHQVVRLGPEPLPTGIPLPQWGGVEPDRAMTIGVGTSAWLLPSPYAGNL